MHDATTADRLRKARGKNNWASKTMRARGGGIISNLGNALLALREDEAFSDAFAYDEMLCTPILLHPLRKKTVNLPASRTRKFVNRHVKPLTRIALIFTNYFS